MRDFLEEYFSAIICFTFTTQLVAGLFHFKDGYSIIQSEINSIIGHIVFFILLGMIILGIVIIVLMGYLLYEVLYDFSISKIRYYEVEESDNPYKSPSSYE